MGQSQTEEFVAFADRLADISRKMLRRAAAQAPEVSIKADASYVTETDRQVEQRLREVISETYPTHGILGEEWGSERLDSEFVWVLDPIDGTAAFIAGIPVHGTLIALTQNGAPYIGVIDHPMTRERLAGAVGSGAKRNGSPIRTRPCTELSGALMTCSNPDFMSPEERARFCRLRGTVQYTQYGGSCYAYGVLAVGRTDLAVDCGLEPVDIMAPAAIIIAAGGAVSDWDGAPINIAWKGHVAAAGDRTALDLALHMLTDTPGLSSSDKKGVLT